MCRVSEGGNLGKQRRAKFETRGQINVNGLVSPKTLSMIYSHIVGELGALGWLVYTAVTF